MTTLSKASWTIDDNHVNLSMNFAKVNKAKRLVSGFATLDNTDSQGDIVLAEASRKAFSRARGNLREMHKKDSAVGKVVDFREKEFRGEDGKVYKGIFVTARVSEGAPNTWTKVLDGTLTGFSIGGNILDFEEDWNKDAGKQVRVIKDYDLIELSLVDNPANQLANIFQIQKANNGSVTVKGMVAETNILNIFYCTEDKISFKDEGDSASCPICLENAKIIGWLEDGPDSDKKEEAVVNKFLGVAANNTIEGGANMPQELDKNKDLQFTGLIKSAVVDPDEDESVATGNEEGDPTEVPTPAKTEPVDNEKVAELDEPGTVDETEDEGLEIAKRFDDLKVTIEKSVKTTREETAKQIESLTGQINDLQKSFETKTEQFEKKLKDLDTDFEATKANLAGLHKSLNTINSGGALKKSIDYEQSVETKTTENNFWDSAFSVDDLIN